MPINPDSSKPIYMQVAEWLEREILSGRIKAGEKLYSQYQLADIFNINPATAAKGLKRLEEEGVVYKKRGLGMFLSPQAKEMILHRRRTETLTALVDELIAEAGRLGITEKELITLVRSAYRECAGKENRDGGRSE